MIDRTMFHKCMAHIKATMEQMDKDLDIVESVLGGCEKLSAMIDVSPMLDLMAMVCGDSKGFINMFIFKNYQISLPETSITIDAR